MPLHQPNSLVEIQKDNHSLQNVNEIVKEKITELDKLALWITQKVGTMGFFFIIFTWTAIWLGWNSLGPINYRFDPYPAFVFWLFISNMIQIFLMPLIMIGQNLQSKHAEERAEENFKVNVKAELEIETVLMHLENHHEHLMEILAKLEEIKSTKI